MSRRRPIAFTLIELLVVIGIIGVLLAILLPMAERVRHKGYIDKCASNLRSIGQALQMYSDENHGEYPRTIYVPGAPLAFGTNPATSNTFTAAGPVANDVTAAMFLLLRTQKMPAELFICPYDDVFAFEKDSADIQSRSNFTDQKKNLGYSLADPYPDNAAVSAGYKWTNRLGSEFAVASDKNPGTDEPRDDVIDVTPTSGQDEMNVANSENHEKEGQNVLYGDGHVEWTRSPFCGVASDNIFTNQNKRLDASPVTKDDSLLLPTDD